MANIILTGDIMFGRSFNEKFRMLNDNNEDLKVVYGNIYPLLIESDGVFGNLETTITSHNKKYTKVFNYKLDPIYKEILKEGNIQYISLANNHICDFNQKGLQDTKDNLNRLNIHHSGAGTSFNKARKPSIFTINNITFAVFSLADHYDYWKSRKLSNKTFKSYNKNKNKSLKKKNPHLDCLWHVDLFSKSEVIKCMTYLRNFKQSHPQIDHIIFSCHINHNYVEKIKPEYIHFCRKLIDNGANLVYCHSPHHVLPYERYKGKCIFYSLAAFIDDYAINNFRNDLSFLPRIHFTKNGYTFNEDDIVFTKIKNMTLNRIKKQKEIDFVKNNILYKQNPDFKKLIDYTFKK